MTQSITGQYECLHHSGIGLDYFTSRIDRLILQANGRFVLTVQNRSRIAHAAQALANGEQVTAAAPETRQEGSSTQEGNAVSLSFDHGGFEAGKLSWNGEGIQLGPNFFTKVSDSTLLPPTHRLKKDMDDITKGLKVASTLGNMAVKAVKAVQGKENVGGREPEVSTSANTSRGPSPQTLQAETRFCDQCGARCDVGKRFCNKCGARLS